MPRRGDVVLHVADEQCFLGLQVILAENFMNFFALIPDIGVRPVNKGVEPVALALHFEMVAVNRAEQKGAKFFRATEFQKIPRMWQFHDGTLRLPELCMEPCFQLGHRHMRRMAIVKPRERQLKFLPEFVEGHRRFSGLGEDKIGGLQHSG